MELRVARWEAANLLRMKNSDKSACRASLLLTLPAIARVYDNKRAVQ
jgi:hypothetical protein